MTNPAERVHIALQARVRQVQNCVHDLRVVAYDGPVPKFLSNVPADLYPKVMILSPGTWSETLNHPTAIRLYAPQSRKYMGLQVIVSPEIPSGEVVVL